MIDNFKVKWEGLQPELGTSNTIYAAYYRLKTNKTPNIKCGLKNDRFTVDDELIGNGALTYPIGLITADEVNLGGLIFSSSNTANYLHTAIFYWTMSPYNYDIRAYAWMFGDVGYWYSNGTVDLRGVRPVINLKPETPITGTGTTSDSYIVQI